MPTWTRANALLTMTSALAADTLIPISFDAQEAISQPFYFDVQAICQTGVVDTDSLLNNPACIVVQAKGTPVRYFHGIVRSVSAEGPFRGQSGTSDNQLYRLVLVPRLWFLNQTVDCRVYQNMSAGDIIQAMFQDAGLTDLSGPPTSTAREYTVQFNESDLHFATRLMEEEGWYYFFQHSASAHTLVIANQNTAFTAISGATLHLGGGDSEGMLLQDFNRAAATVRGNMKFKDYDPVNPDTLLQNEQPTTLKTGGGAARDDFRWPALTFDSGTVTDRSKREMEAAEAQAALFDGATQFAGLVPGGKFTVSSLPASPYDSTYAVRSVTHHASDDTWVSGSGSPSYACRFTCFPATVTWRQPLVTPRPRMDGVHTALVMGPQSTKAADIKSQDGEEIHTDDLGRVKVRFYWDHRGEATGSDAVWARVIQPWAGKGWGAQFIPRVGTEVAVAFVDGDPDRPIVIGGLYNGRDTPIYLKADKNKVGIRTRSVQKGSLGTNFSEFTIDDTKDSELVFFHAEKDYTTEVEHDQTHKVDNCRIVTVKQDETVDIQNNQTIKVKQDHKFTVTDGNRSVTVSKGNNTFEVTQGNHDETIGQGNHTHNVKMGNYAVTVGQGNHTFDVKMGNHDTKVDMGNASLKLAMGNYSVKADLGQVTIEAMTGIELKVGENSVKLDPSGVTINGIMVTMKGTGMATVQSPMTQVKGDGMLILKGGIMMLN
jgi:type VI secretion system secreted protein VgrG